MQTLIFNHHEAKFHLRTDCFHVCTETIREQRALLDAYVRRQPEFVTAMEPIELLPDAPDIVLRMHRACLAFGVGPMAAVAGVFAELAARAATEAGAKEAVVDNGGDIFVVSDKEVTLGLFAGDSPLSGKLALRIFPSQMPVAVCSSSSRMGHSISLGDCDLATVVADDGALADAGATHAANLVRSQEDIEPALKAVGSVSGIRGLLIIKGDRVGVEGDLPRIVRNLDPQTADKITRHSGTRRPHVIV